MQQMRPFTRLIALPILLAAIGGIVSFGRNLSADDVLRYPVPDALTFQDGRPVRNTKDWDRRRTEILNLFAEQVYGRTPKFTTGVRFQSTSLVKRGTTSDGKAKWKEVAIRLTQGSESRTIHVLLYLPANKKGPSPVFVGLNFRGNHAVDANPDLTLPEIWARDPADTGTAKNNERRKLIRRRADVSSRGEAASRWQVEKIVSHGYGLATVYYGDIEPDFDGGLPYGVRPLLFRGSQKELAPDEWGALGAWAWGLSRIADYLASDEDIDSKRIAILGHSRLGKAALWAAAQDKRFSIVISNESGVGGASLYRARSGETIEHLNTAFPHWFSLNFHQYTGHPDKVPVDGNLLLALVAPRPLYVASAEQDLTSNPRAEFYSAVLVSKVYELLGKQGLGTAAMPPVNQPIMHTVAYHERSGKHDVTAFDWDQYIAFADQQAKGAN
jgi:hypothetical protein